MAKYSVYRENTKNISLSLNDVDLTGATIYFTVKTAADDDAMDNTAIIKKDVTSHIDAVNGETIIALAPSDTDVTPGKYFYDMKLKKANGDQITFDTGKFEVKPAYTNRG